MVVRVEMPEGLHIYDEPVPTGMVATAISVDGPEWFRHEPLEAPATHAFELPSVDATLQVWDGTVDFVLPVYASSGLGRALRDGMTSVEIDVTVRYQACDDSQCFIPRSRTLRLDVPVSPGAMPNFGEMRGITGHTVEMDARSHLKRLIERKQAG